MRTFLPKYLLLCLLSLVFSGLQAQDQSTDILSGNDALRALQRPDKNLLSFHLESKDLPLQKTPSIFIKQISGEFFGDLKVIKTVQDELGFSHSTYRQYIDGVPVFGGVVKIHMNLEGMQSVHGYLYKAPEKSSGSFVEEEARDPCIGLLKIHLSFNCYRRCQEKWSYLQTLGTKR